MKNVGINFLVLFTLVLTNKLIAQDVPLSIHQPKNFSDIEGNYKVISKEINKSGRIEKLKGNIKIKEGKIEAKFALLNGFPNTNYQVENVDEELDKITISAVSNSESGAKLTWAVEIIGKKIIGTATRDDTGTVYHIKGKLK